MDANDTNKIKTPLAHPKQQKQEINEETQEIIVTQNSKIVQS